jgi:hypothetical protein
LVYRRYVGRILPRLVKTNSDLAQPSKFARIQRTEYALTVFKCFLRPPVLGFVERTIPAETRGEVYRAFLGAKIEEYLKGEEPVAHCVLQATVDYVNDWRALFNETTNGKQASCAANHENDYPQCQYVVKAVDLMVLCQLFLQISRMRFPFPAPIPAKGEVSQESRQAALIEMVSSVSSTYYRGGRLIPLNWKETKVWGNKRNWVETVAIPACSDAKFLLQRAEVTFKDDFERGDEQSGVGNRILLFLEIEKRLRPVLTCEHVAVGTSKRQALFGALLDGQDPWFFRAFFMQGLDVIEQLGDDKVPGLPDLAKIRNPITADILGPMRRMAGWFLLGDEEEN